MNYIKHLTGFFNLIASEKDLKPTHISLYLSLFQSWNLNRFKNPITINREDMMKASKIAAPATYHKCIKKFQDMGLLEYCPSYNPHSGTVIFMLDLAEGFFKKMMVPNVTLSKNELLTTQRSDEKEFRMNLTLSKNELLNEQVNEQLYIYNIKTNTNKISKTNTNKIYIEPDVDFLNLNSPFQKNEIKSESKKLKTETVQHKIENEIPAIETVKEYFEFQGNIEFEAERFFNYYSSNGWLIGGKTTMKDWKASARNWMLNTSKFTVKIPKNNQTAEQISAQNFHIIIDKDYAEPL